MNSDPFRSAPKAHHVERLTTAMAMLVSGPAAAIQPSALGVEGSRESRATPPSAQSWIDSVLTPNRRAVRAWPNSCSRIESRKPMVPAIAASMPIARDRLLPISSAMSPALQWALTRMPAKRPRGIEPLMLFPSQFGSG